MCSRRRLVYDMLRCLSIAAIASNDMPRLIPWVTSVCRS
jgi:hypothetical protein